MQMKRILCTALVSMCCFITTATPPFVSGHNEIPFSAVKASASDLVVDGNQSGSASLDQMELGVHSSTLITLDIRGADLRDVLSALALKMGMNMVLVDTAPTEVNINLKNVPVVKALEQIMQSYGLNYVQYDGMIVIGKPETLQSGFYNEMILTRIDTNYVTSDKLVALIGQLGIPVKVFSVEGQPNKVWLQGTVQGLKKAKELIESVDVEGRTSLELDYRTLEVAQIPPQRAVELLDKIGITLKHYVILDRRILVFDSNLFSQWEQISTVLQQFDNQDGKEQKTFVYQLRNIVAKDAKGRLDQVGIKDVKVVIPNSEQFARDVIIVCPPYAETQVRNILSGLDVSLTKVKAPVAYSNSSQTLNEARDLASEMSGVSLGSFHISNNLKPRSDEQNSKYILWVEETPDRIQLIKDLLKDVVDKDSSQDSNKENK
ncbi:energy transducer TonB [Heliobacillus mobilis]|uniref:Energy transducer TonB n=1 Tax=Heliobacterium mobile TaxID=28064 RepID=A0A6I3SKG1_HELMO|nr:STN domain-containing protein [Heliobacterium mobile]MTV49383.1 energy transducer TonB [Heliobacterium mobile]